MPNENIGIKLAHNDSGIWLVHIPMDKDTNPLINPKAQTHIQLTLFP